MEPGGDSSSTTLTSNILEPASNAIAAASEAAANPQTSSRRLVSLPLPLLTLYHEKNLKPIIIIMPAETMVLSEKTKYARYLTLNIIIIESKEHCHKSGN